VVWISNALAIAAAVAITLCGTNYVDPYFNFAEYGWPWTFGRVNYPTAWSRFAFFRAPISNYPWAFLGDVLVLATAILVLEMARRWIIRRRPRLSMRMAAVALTVVCALLSYGVMRYRWASACTNGSSGSSRAIAGTTSTSGLLSGCNG
jgi:hypothetical protein